VEIGDEQVSALRDTDAGLLVGCGWFSAAHGCAVDFGPTV